MKYYFGVYRDYSENCKIAQLCLTVYDLSCEILADPGRVILHEPSREKAISKAKKLANDNECLTLEVNFEKTRYMKVKK